MSGVDTKALWDLLESLGLDIIDINVDRQQQGLEVVMDEGELLAYGVQILIRQLTRESQKFDALSNAYAALRREHITALVRLHRAHGVVSAASLRHKDEKLAALARDELRGLNKLDAEGKIPRASEVLKKAGL